MYTSYDRERERDRAAAFQQVQERSHKIRDIALALTFILIDMQMSSLLNHIDKKGESRLYCHIVEKLSTFAIIFPIKTVLREQQLES